MRIYTFILFNIVFVFIVFGCKSEKFNKLSTINCDYDVDTFEVPFEVPIAYDKATSIIRRSDSQLALFALEDNQRYKIFFDSEESIVGHNIERGKFFTVYKDGHLYTFNSPFVREYFNDSLINEYEVSDSFSFHGSMTARPSITNEYIIAIAYPNSDLTLDFKQYMQLLNHSPLFVVINRSTGENKVLGKYPTDTFPYNQHEERKYNGLEYSYKFCSIGKEIYMMFRTSSILYKVNIETGEQDIVYEFDHRVFRDLGKDPADETWEQNQKGEYIAANSFVASIVPINNNKQLALIITEKQEMDGNYLDQLANNAYLVMFDIERKAISKIIYIEDHYPYIRYSDESIILLRQRRKISNEQENSTTRYTVVPHACL